MTLYRISVNSTRFCTFDFCISQAIEQYMITKYSQFTVSDVFFLLFSSAAVIIKGDLMRGGGEVDLGATQERGTGEATTGAVVGEGEMGGAGEREEGETEDAVDHHLRPGTEVKGRQRGSLRHHQCTSKLACHTFKFHVPM